MPAGKPYASIGNAICAPDAAPIAQSSESDACYTDRDRHSAAFFAVNGIYTRKLCHPQLYAPDRRAGRKT